MPNQRGVFVALAACRERLETKLGCEDSNPCNCNEQSLCKKMFEGFHVGEKKNEFHQLLMNQMLLQLAFAGFPGGRGTGNE